MRRVQTDDGAFEALVSPGCQLNVLHPCGLKIDPVHRRFIAQWIKADAVVWDIGGNMGLFGFPAALKALRGQVYIFEPDIQLALWLNASARRKANARLAVAAMPFAISDSDGVAEFLIAAHGKSMNKLAGAGPWHDDLFVACERRRVACLRIDTLARSLRAPDIIKIDVEGAELRVLDGGRVTISGARPVMLIECPNELGAGVKAFFDAIDYVLLDGAEDNQQLIETPVWNTVAAPRERWRAQERN